jgi:hypothetical protein
MSEKDLHAGGWAIARPLLREPRERLRKRCRAWIEGADISGSSDFEDLMRSADEGRIETLLLSRDKHVWGRYDETSRKISRADKNAADNEDLLKLLALKTLAQGGDVVSLSEDFAEKAGPAVGLYRY